MSAQRRTSRDERRRRLGQHFLRPELADRLVAEADFRPGELVVEIGAGAGALTIALAHRGIEVLAVEVDPLWARRLRDRLRGAGGGRVRVVEGDVRSFPLPPRPFRVVGSLPFAATPTSFGDCSTTRRHRSSGRTWSCSGRSPASGPPSLLRRCSRPCGRRGGNFVSATGSRRRSSDRSRRSMGESWSLLDGLPHCCPPPSPALGPALCEHTGRSSE